MKILFLGGDKRYTYIMKELAQAHSVYQTGFSSIENVIELEVPKINLSEYEIVIFPISGINDKQEIKSEKGAIYLPDILFSKKNNKTRYFTGIKTKKLLELIPEKQIISFLDYEKVEKVNNALTVERSYGQYKRKTKK